MNRNSNPKVAIITSGYLPVPNVNGGAVEALDTVLIKENEKKGDLDLTIFTCWGKGIEDEVIKYSKTKFNIIPVPLIIEIADRMLFFFAKHILKKKKLMSYRFMAQRLWYIDRVALELAKSDYSCIVIENHPSLFLALKKRDNDRKYKNKVLYHLHNEILSDYGCIKQIEGIARVLGVSQYIVNSLDVFLYKKNGYHLRLSQKAVFRNCVDIDRFNPQNSHTKEMGYSFKKTLGIPRDEHIILFSGRLTEEKGALELITAFSQLDREDVTLVIAGAYFYNSDIASPFEEKLHSISTNCKIKFTGYVPYKDMPAVYAMADICCLPSIWNDPAPLAVIESLASGKPIITTYSGGIPEYVDENAAIILDPDEKIVNNLVLAFNKLLNDENLRTKMGHHSRRLARSLSLSEYYSNFYNYIIESV